MKKLIIAVIIFTTLTNSEEYGPKDIKVSCECENKNSWKVEKIPENIAQKFFENYKYLLKQYYKNIERILHLD